MKKVIMPRIDEVQKNGRVSKWLKAVGDEVNENEPIAEALSEKITFEITAPVSGRLFRIFVEEEVDVSIGSVIALIAERSDTKGALDDAAKKIQSKLGEQETKISQEEQDLR